MPEMLNPNAPLKETHDEKVIYKRDQLTSFKVFEETEVSQGEMADKVAENHSERAPAVIENMEIFANEALENAPAPEQKPIDEGASVEEQRTTDEKVAGTPFRQPVEEPESQIPVSVPLEQEKKVPYQITSEMSGTEIENVLNSIPGSAKISELPEKTQNALYEKAGVELQQKLEGEIEDKIADVAAKTGFDRQFIRDFLLGDEETFNRAMDKLEGEAGKVKRVNITVQKVQEKKFGSRAKGDWWIISINDKDYKVPDGDSVEDWIKEFEGRKGFNVNQLSYMNKNPAYLDRLEGLGSSLATFRKKNFKGMVGDECQKVLEHNENVLKGSKLEILADAFGMKVGGCTKEDVRNYLKGVREGFKNRVKEILSDPVGTIKAIASQTKDVTVSMVRNPVKTVFDFFAISDAINFVGSVSDFAKARERNEIMQRANNVVESFGGLAKSIAIMAMGGPIGKIAKTAGTIFKGAGVAKLFQVVAKGYGKVTGGAAAAGGAEEGA